MAGPFKRDSKGIAEILKSPGMAAIIKAKGEEIAANITAQHPEIEPGVHPGVTDRAAVVVAIAEGDVLQATEGLVTRAAAAAGLEVRSR